MTTQVRWYGGKSTQTWQCCWLEPWGVVLGTLAWGQAAFGAHCDICPSRGDGGVRKKLESRRHISCGKVRGKFLRAGWSQLRGRAPTELAQLESAKVPASVTCSSARLLLEPAMATALAGN